MDIANTYNNFQETMRLITGDECGLLKECNPALVMKANDKTNGATMNNSSAEPSSTVVTSEKEGILRINPIEHASRHHGVVALAWNEPDRDNRFSSLHSDGVVELWELTCNENTSRKPSFGKYRHAGSIANVFGNTDRDNEYDALSDPFSRPMGLSRLSRNGKNLLCACNHSGRVVVLDPEDDKHRIFSFDAFPVKSSATRENNKSLYPRVSAMAVDEPTGRIAMGGKERETALFDLETSKQVWKAKNLPPDAQTLLQPQVWPTAILFLQQQHQHHQQQHSPGQNIMAVGTAYAQVRIYDVRVGNDSTQRRRPIQTTPAGFLEHRVTSLCQIGSTSEIVVGDAAGFLHAIDLRKLPTAVERVKTTIAKQEQIGTHGRFVGPTGSIRQIVQNNRNNKMAVVGLDRMLRIYDTNKKRKELICFYLKQRLSCVLMGQEEDICRFDSKDDAQEIYERYTYNEQEIDQEDLVDDYIDSDDEDNSSSENEDKGEDAGEVDSDIINDASDDHSGEEDAGRIDEEDEDVVHTRKKQRQ